jgi:hypothetical protein
MKFTIKIFSTFLSIAFIAFILISPVVTFKYVNDANDANKEERYLASVGKCVIANGLTSIILNSKFLPHTIFCIIIDLIFHEEGGDFISETVKEFLLSMLFELINKWFGVFGGAREIFKKSVRIIRRLLL